MTIATSLKWYLRQNNLLMYNRNNLSSSLTHYEFFLIFQIYLLFQFNVRSQDKIQYAFIFHALRTCMLCRNTFFQNNFLCPLQKICFFVPACLLRVPSSLSSSVMFLLLFLTNDMVFLFTICQFLLTPQYFGSTVNVIAFFFLHYCCQSLLNRTQIPLWFWKPVSNPVSQNPILINTCLSMQKVC